MLLEVFKAHTNPEKVDLLLHIVSHDLITPEIAKDALQKSGRSFHVIPQKAWTPEVAETAVKSDPSSLGWVPSNMRTADMILFTKKLLRDITSIFQKRLARAITFIHSTKEWKI